MGEDGSPQAVFELCDGAQARTAPDVLGVWTTAPSFDSTQDRPFDGVYPERSRGTRDRSSPAAGVAFDTTAVATAEPPVWRANLPADPNLAAAHLDSAEASLDASRAALTTAADRIDALVEEREGQSTGLAFDVSAAGAELAQPERELLALLKDAEKGLPSVSGEAVSFGAGEDVGGGWRQATQQFQGFVDRLQQVVTHYAWVETHTQGQLLGRTTVGWTGDMDTAWQEGLDPAQAALHQRTLTLALASREMLIRTFVVVASGAARLSMLLSTPVGAILALPAAWKFINQVRDEIEKHQQITKEI